MQTYTVQGWEKIHENLTKSIIFTKYIKIIVRVSCHFQMAVKLYKLKKLYWAREPHVHCSCTHFSILWFQNLGRVPRQGEHGRVLGPQIIGRISGLKIGWGLFKSSLTCQLLHGSVQHHQQLLEWSEQGGGRMWKLHQHSQFFFRP